MFWWPHDIYVNGRRLNVHKSKMDKRKRYERTKKESHFLKNILFLSTLWLINKNIRFKISPNLYWRINCICTSHAFNSKNGCDYEKKIDLYNFDFYYAIIQYKKYILTCAIARWSSQRSPPLPQIGETYS